MDQLLLLFGSETTLRTMLRPCFMHKVRTVGTFAAPTKLKQRINLDCSTLQQ
jgi:hypothetical protein